MLMQDNAPDLEVPDIVPVQEPHKDFIFNEDQFLLLKTATFKSFTAVRV